MRIAIAGGHGRVALLLGDRLVRAGHEVTGLVRNPDHFDDVADTGMTPVLCDIEVARTATVTDVLQNHDGAVFAAGAGSGSGPARKETVDFAGAVRFTDACLAAGVERFVMLSSIGADDPPMDNEAQSVYLRAKRRADDHLMSTILDWTIVRSGRLTNRAPSGVVDLGHRVTPGAISRADLADVLAHAMHTPDTIGAVFEVVGGATSIPAAIASFSEMAA